MKLFGRDEPRKDTLDDKLTDIEKPQPEKPHIGMPELEENPRLRALLSGMLQRACKEVAETGNQTEFGVIQIGSDDYVQGFDNPRHELAYDEARRAVLSAPAEAQRYALSYAGYSTVQGVRYETVFIGGGQRGDARGVVLGQRYRQRLPDVKYEPVGNPMLGAGENLLTLSTDPDAESKIRSVFVRITADVAHNHGPGHDEALTYEFRKCQEVILSFGDLDMPFLKELQKRPDGVHVVMGRNVWATMFKPDAKEVYLARDTLVPFRGNRPFTGFDEDGMIMIVYMPPLPTGENPPKSLGFTVLWATMFRITDKDTAK